MKNIIKIFFVVMMLALVITTITSCEIPGLTPEDPACEHTGGTATCSKKAICELCGEAYGELAEHKPELLPAVEATCMNVGFTSGSKCSACGLVLEAQQKTELGDHNYVAVEALGETCYTDGYTAHTKCAYCGDEQGKTIIPGGHKCGDDGVCTVCNSLIVSTYEELVAALANGGEFKLGADIQLDADTTLVVSGESVIDLDGHTLSGLSDETGSNRNMFDVNKGTLTVKNGTIILEHVGENMGWSNSTNVFNVTAGGILTIENAKVYNFGGSDMAFCVHLNNWGEVTLNVESSDLVSTYIAIRVFNSGNDMNNVTIKNSHIEGANRAFWVHMYTLADFKNDTAKQEAAALRLNFDMFDGTNEFVGNPEKAGPICYGFTNGIYFDANGEHVHSYSEKVVAPTCTEAGYTEFTCNCGDSYTEDGEAAAGHTYTDHICSVCGEADPTYEAGYYLIGYINGADYGCNDDHANLGTYQFVDGKLTAKFTADSYVFIKSSNAKGENLNWYMTAAYTTSKTATYKNTSTGAAEKMYVPGNVEIVFTLTVNEDGTLTLVADYTVVDSGDHTYTVAGSDETLFGTTWDPANTANQMTYDEATGLWTISYTNSGTSSICPNFKVCQDGGWTKCWGGLAAGQQYDNAYIDIPAGKTLTITFNAETETITLIVE